MSRWRAFGIHLFISALLTFLFVAVCWWLWFPSPLFVAMNVLGLLGIVIGVDVVMGPSLTLLVFKSGKPSLKFDLTVIALLQLVALGYGIWMTTLARPLYVVLDSGRLQVALTADLPLNTEAAETDWWNRLLSLGKGPAWVSTGRPADPGAEAEDLLNSLNDKTAVVFDVTKYQALTSQDKMLLAAAKPLTSLLESIKTPVEQNKLQEQLKAEQLKGGFWLPIAWRDQKGAAIFASGASRPQIIWVFDEDQTQGTKP